MRGELACGVDTFAVTGPAKSADIVLVLIEDLPAAAVGQVMQENSRFHPVVVGESQALVVDRDDIAAVWRDYKSSHSI